MTTANTIQYVFKQGVTFMADIP